LGDFRQALAAAWSRAFPGTINDWLQLAQQEKTRTPADTTGANAREFLRHTRPTDSPRG
jgi:hypothetical protein